MGPQPRDETQDVPDWLLRDCDLDHLDHKIAAIVHHRGAELGDLLKQAHERPVPFGNARRRKKLQSVFACQTPSLGEWSKFRLVVKVWNGSNSALGGRRADVRFHPDS